MVSRREAFAGWSTACGMATIGTPNHNPSVQEPIPAWLDARPDEPVTIADLVGVTLHDPRDQRQASPWCTGHLVEGQAGLCARKPVVERLPVGEAAGTAEERAQYFGHVVVVALPGHLARRQLDRGHSPLVGGHWTGHATDVVEHQVGPVGIEGRVHLRQDMHRLVEENAHAGHRVGVVEALGCTGGSRQHGRALHDVGARRAGQVGQMPTDQIIHPMAPAHQFVDYRQMRVHMAGAEAATTEMCTSSSLPVEYFQS